MMCGLLAPDVLRYSFPQRIPDSCHFHLECMKLVHAIHPYSGCDKETATKQHTHKKGAL